MIVLWFVPVRRARAWTGPRTAANSRLGGGENLLRGHGARRETVGGGLVGQALQGLVDRGGDAVLTAEQGNLPVQEVRLDRPGAAGQRLPGRTAAVGHAGDLGGVHVTAPDRVHFLGSRVAD